MNLIIQEQNENDVLALNHPRCEIARSNIWPCERNVTRNESRNS